MKAYEFIRDRHSLNLLSIFQENVRTNRFLKTYSFSKPNKLEPTEKASSGSQISHI